MREPALSAAAALTDEDLAHQVLAGRVELFELIMRRNNQRLYRSIRSLLRDEAEVEDAMQQAYISAYTHLAGFDGAARLSTWLVRIGINEALGRLRKRKKLVALVDDDRVSAEANPEDAVANREIGTALANAVDALPDLYRVVFVLREIEGMSTEDAAIALSVSTDVIKTRLHRAKGLLQEKLAALAAAHLPGTYPFPASRCDRVVAAVMQVIRGP